MIYEVEGVQFFIDKFTEIINKIDYNRLIENILNLLFILFTVITGFLIVVASLCFSLWEQIMIWSNKKTKTCNMNDSYLLHTFGLVGNNIRIGINKLQFSDSELHNHEYNHINIVLWGGYNECVLENIENKEETVEKYWRGIGFCQFIPMDFKNKIELKKNINPWILEISFGKKNENWYLNLESELKKEN
jgi:hypothetical protein